jgi:hypothetical protein
MISFFFHSSMSAKVRNRTIGFLICCTNRTIGFSICCALPPPTPSVSSARAAWSASVVLAVIYPVTSASSQSVSTIRAIYSCTPVLCPVFCIVILCIPPCYFTGSAFSFFFFFVWTLNSHVQSYKTTGRRLSPGFFDVSRTHHPRED